MTFQVVDPSVPHAFRHHIGPSTSCDHHIHGTSTWGLAPVLCTCMPHILCVCVRLHSLRSRAQVTYYVAPAAPSQQGGGPGGGPVSQVSRLSVCYLMHIPHRLACLREGGASYVFVCLSTCQSACQPIVYYPSVRLCLNVCQCLSQSF